MDKETIIAILAIILVIVGGLIGFYLINQERCDQKSISFKEHKYGYFSGCMVKHNDLWLPLENIRGFGDE